MKISKVMEKLRAYQGNPHQDIKPKIEVKRELETLPELEEMYWNQRSKTVWLKNGDRNTKFFQQKASQRKRWNTIDKIQNNEGTWLETDEQINSHAAEFYKEL